MFHKVGACALSFILSLALIVAGCVTEPAPEPVEQTELRSNDGPSQWILAVGDQIADDIVADEAFQAFVTVTAELAGDLVRAQQLLPDEDLDSILHTINEPWFAETMAPQDLLAHLGGNPQHLDQMNALVAQLRANHGLQGASPEDIGYVFELAFATDAAQLQVRQAIEAELPPTPAWTPCEAACYAIYMAEFVIIFGVFAVAMAVAVVTVPFGLILAAIAIAVFEDALALIQFQLALCLAECDGTAGDVDICGDADICEEDEYCWTGVLGIGADECRPKKAQGKACANHGQCLSGCCQYHFWSNPVSKVCRPANKC